MKLQEFIFRWRKHKEGKLTSQVKIRGFISLSFSFSLEPLALNSWNTSRSGDSLGDDLHVIIVRVWPLW
ncbi:MAG: hypothetical protein A2Y79_00280 [Deltaproteobacteria bacterium RBG_13_43_22]|nr:MAG: hypothetical protein A2Y79_00280 [Deltaproteobacteria bacterium RBG_13_43_22]